MEIKMEVNLEQQFDLNLIEAVRINPVIYDRSHYNYKHFVRKTQVWKQISESLGVPGNYKGGGVERVREFILSLPLFTHSRCIHLLTN